MAIARTRERSCRFELIRRQSARRSKATPYKRQRTGVIAVRVKVQPQNLNQFHWIAQ